MNPIHKKHCANHQHVPISPSMFPRLTPLCVAQCKASVPLTGHFCMISLIVPGFLSHVTMVHCRAAWIYPLSGLPRGISGGPSTSQSPNQEDSCRRRYRTNAQRAPLPPTCHHQAPSSFLTFVVVLFFTSIQLQPCNPNQIRPRSPSKNSRTV